MVVKGAGLADWKLATGIGENDVDGTHRNPRMALGLRSTGGRRLSMFGLGSVPGPGRAAPGQHLEPEISRSTIQVSFTKERELIMMAFP